MRIRLAWVPPFVVGATAATAASVAVALLLYSGEGMIRSLTLIVAVELGALGLGLRGPPTSTWLGVVDALRRRWLWALVAFLAASVFTVAWTVGQGFGAHAGAQALGLALLGGLPLYAAGRLLAAISTIWTVAERSGSGGFAALGGSLGVLVTGAGGLSRLGAPSLLFVCLVLLSGTALIQGTILKDLQEALTGVAVAPPGVEPESESS